MYQLEYKSAHINITQNNLIKKTIFTIKYKNNNHYLSKVLVLSTKKIIKIISLVIYYKQHQCKMFFYLNNKSLLKK